MKTRTPAETLALAAFVNLSRAADSVHARTGAVIAEEGLTEGRFGVLEALHHLGPLCAKELAGKLLRTKGNLTMVLGNLERDGLVRRETSAEDARRKVVALTPKGKRLIAGAFPRHARLVARELSILTKSEQETLRRLCRMLGTGRRS